MDLPDWNFIENDFLVQSVKPAPERGVWSRWCGVGSGAAGVESALEPWIGLEFRSCLEPVGAGL